uniref:SFRICE_025887 n=1 Tax=Spodoptera frugiperda TaxID=7108 RepID=A0A2H1WRF7_SPOFR
MPEDSKKNNEKIKERRERKPRNRNQKKESENVAEKKTEEPKNVPKVTVPQKPVYEAPPPEFYKNLKRETDEILKITEEENSKYKKKEIQSNWAKYEVPIDSYEEIEEQENLGADYEKLIQAPLSIGGHFQFKHEKSWDMNTGPSLYDKYFDINMEDLNIALCSIPFYERNSIETSNFTETDILTMNNRATRFKQKYYNDKSYSTPETEAQDKILSNLMDSLKEDNIKRDTSNDIDLKYDNARKTRAESEKSDSYVELQTENKTEVTNAVEENLTTQERVSDETKVNKIEVNEDKLDDFIFGDTNKNIKEPVVDNVPTPSSIEKPVRNIETVESTPVVEKVVPTVAKTTPNVAKENPVPTATAKVTNKPEETKKNPVIESPEDLEKWLDDFLDG